jgi:predicted GNAT family acetyltransferase
MTDRHTVEIPEDPSAFLTAASAYLEVDPLLTTVVSTVTHRVRRQVEAGRPAPLMPYPMFVLPMADEAAVALARAVHERGEEVRGVNGCLPAAGVVAVETARLLGGTARAWQHTRLFELWTLVEPRRVPGTLRLATGQDLDLCLAWFTAFHVDAAEQAGRDLAAGPSEAVNPENVMEGIVEERVLLWEVDGEVVHLTGCRPPSFGVARVGPVYTPRQYRGRGYASAGVAEASRRLLAAGARVCLFTDQANPTSNKVYVALGYEPVVDMANLVID